MAYELKSSSRDCKKCLVLGEADWKVNDDTVLKPDVVLICNETHKFKIYEEEKVKYYVLVYPNDLKAKVYRLDGKEYTKEGDFSLETYDFEETTCKASINFANVFERFRK